jgi:hypothetical protein
MKVIKGLIVAAILIFLGLVCSCQALAVHDRNTRQDVLALVAKELPVGASLDDMRAFLQRHAARFDLDDRFKHDYAGILPQSRLDRNLFDRRVGIELYFDKDHRFTTAQVNVFYTFL